MQEKGEISGIDLAQKVSRYVRDKEINSTRFTIWGEVCNDNTVAAMVAISGDERYGGKLNIMWGEYGTVPLVGVFLPAMACSGKPPGILRDIFNETLEKKEYAKTSIENLYSAYRVKEIQQYAFAAENFSFNEYANLLANIPDSLNETEILITLHDFVEHLTSIIADMYINESSSLPEYAEPFSIEFEPQLTQTTTTSPFINETTTTANPPPTNNVEPDPIVIIVIAGIAGLSIPLVGYYLIIFRLKKHN
jgi:hypothetical protein